MAIPVKLEDKNELKKWGLGLENLLEDCVFCHHPTEYWNIKTNQPICQNCAKSYTVSEIPKK